MSTCDVTYRWYVTGFVRCSVPSVENATNMQYVSKVVTVRNATEDVRRNGKSVSGARFLNTVKKG